MLIIFTFCRKIDSIIMNKIFDFDSSLLLTLLMFLGEFSAGLSLYFYEKRFLSRKKSKEQNNTFMGVKLIKETSHLSSPDSNLKIYILLFIASYFDFIEFMLSTLYLPKFNEISQTLEMRLSSILIISSSLFFYFLLKFPIFKHQMLSLSIIFICLIIIIIMEFFFQILDQKRSFLEFITILLLIFLIHFFNSLLDSIEKYLLEYDFLNPFLTLMLEGFLVLY